jgi:lysophospholipase L1-like esterase
LIGDSISIGYTLPVRELLEGKANVHRIAANGGPTTNGLAHLDAWLGKGKWDVIHFNWGLHDLKHVDPSTKALVDPSQGNRQVTPEAYEKNLRELVRRLKKTGAKLIWCSTTPVPAGAAGRIPGDAVKYNAIAAAIMADEGVTIDDLYAFAQPQLAKIQRPKNVHFTPEGSRALAEKVSKSISAALAR